MPRFSRRLLFMGEEAAVAALLMHSGKAEEGPTKGDVTGKPRMSLRPLYILSMLCLWDLRTSAWESHQYANLYSQWMASSCLSLVYPGLVQKIDVHW